MPVNDVSRGVFVRLWLVICRVTIITLANLDPREIFFMCLSAIPQSEHDVDVFEDDKVIEGSMSVG
jgi:hypothetical protein